jgi:hypothetical protein
MGNMHGVRYDINMLLASYLSHYSIICFKNKRDIVAAAVKFWLFYFPRNELMQECIKKYDVKIDGL